LGACLRGELYAKPLRVALVHFPVEPIDKGVPEQPACLRIYFVLAIENPLTFGVSGSESGRRGRRGVCGELSQSCYGIVAQFTEVRVGLCSHALKLRDRSCVQCVERRGHPWSPMPVNPPISPLARIFNREVVYVVVGRVGRSRRGEGYRGGLLIISLDRGCDKAVRHGPRQSQPSYG
jgi:hypothetical protein